MQVKQRNEQIDALQQQILGLERTRDRYVCCCPDRFSSKFNLMECLTSGFHSRCTSTLEPDVQLCCSLAEELVSAAQAVESGKEVERKLSSMQAEYSKVHSVLSLSQIKSYSCNVAFTSQVESTYARGVQLYEFTYPHMIDWHMRRQCRD